MVSEVYEDPRASYDWISVMEHILVIDDERSMLEFLELLLRKEGYQVTLLEDGRKVDPDVPFIFITAFASAPTAIEALKLGAFDYITKPFQVNDFKNLVRAALQARRWKKRAGHPSFRINRGSSWLPWRFIERVLELIRLSYRSIVVLSPRPYWKANFSDTPEEPSPEP